MPESQGVTDGDADDYFRSLCSDSETDLSSGCDDDED